MKHPWWLVSSPRHPWVGCGTEELLILEWANSRKLSRTTWWLVSRKWNSRRTSGLVHVKRASNSQAHIQARHSCLLQAHWSYYIWISLDQPLIKVLVVILLSCYCWWLLLVCLDFLSRWQEQDRRHLQDLRKKGAKRVQDHYRQGTKWSWLGVQEHKSWGILWRIWHQARVLFHLHTSTKWSCWALEQDIDHASKSHVGWLWHLPKVLGESIQHGVPCIQLSLPSWLLEEDSVRATHWEKAQHLIFPGVWL